MCSSSNLAQDAERQLRERCISCVVKLCDELRKRLPDNFKILKKMTLFSVEHCLRVVKEPIIDIAELLGYLPEEIDRIDSQWRNLTIVKWQETKSTEKFWVEVSNYKDAAGVNSFQDICHMALSVLSLPHSNAEVERLFSQINIVKNKLRNRLTSKTVSAVLAVRSGLRRVEQSCYSYEMPEDIVKKIGTMEAYTTPGTSTQSSSQPGTVPAEHPERSEDEELEDSVIFSLN